MGQYATRAMREDIEVCLAAAQTSDLAPVFAAPWLQEQTQQVAEARAAREALLDSDPRYRSMTDDEIRECEEIKAAALAKAKAEEEAIKAEKAAQKAAGQAKIGGKVMKVKKRKGKDELAEEAKEAESEANSKAGSRPGSRA